MKILGIHIDHQASACVIENGKLIYYNQEERLSKLRKDGRFPFYCIDQIKQKFNKIDYCAVTGYNINTGQNEIISKYLIYIGLINDINNCYFFDYSHHLAHAVKAYYSSGFKKAIIFVVDGKGSTYQNGFESTSVFKWDSELNLVYKNLVTNVKDIGQFYSNVSEFLGWKDEEGKLMGFASYGLPNELIKKELHTNIFSKEHPEQTSENFKKYALQHKEDLAYETQTYFESRYLDIVKKHIIPGYDIIMTGGTSLNVTNNYKIRQYLPKETGLYIEPVCGDEGNSIGIAIWLLISVFKKQNINTDSISNIYLNPTYKYTISSGTDSIDNAINILLDKKVLALYQGPAEAGPRALGNRSLLLDPRISNGKDIMNKIKNRESFRPFACSVIEEKAHEWFDMTKIKTSPHMMYAIKVKDNKKNIIPSVVHVDDTCRIQTVNEKTNPILYKLLISFYNKTGVPLLMNTSFNLAGQPIVETPEDAIKTFEKSNIECFYFPEINKILYK
jgi:carbamoyltransferase